MRVPSCFPVERYGELHGFFEVSWIDENVLSLDHDLSALSEERCEDIHDGNLVGIELSCCNEASDSQLNAEHRGIRLRVQEIRHWLCIPGYGGVAVPHVRAARSHA